MVTNFGFDSSFSCPPKNERARLSRESRWETRERALAPERLSFPRANLWFRRFHVVRSRNRAAKPPLTGVRHNRKEGTNEEHYTRANLSGVTRRCFYLWFLAAAHRSTRGNPGVRGPDAANRVNRIRRTGDAHCAVRPRASEFPRGEPPPFGCIYSFSGRWLDDAANRGRASRGYFFCPGRKSEGGARGEMRRGGGARRCDGLRSRPRRRAGLFLSTRNEAN